MVGISIRNEENQNDKAVGISFRRKDQISGDVIWSVFEKVTQSNARFNVIYRLVVDVHSLKMPVGFGRGLKSKDRPMAELAHLKRSIVFMYQLQKFVFGSSCLRTICPITERLGLRSGEGVWFQITTPRLFQKDASRMSLTTSKLSASPQSEQGETNAKLPGGKYSSGSVRISSLLWGGMIVVRKARRSYPAALTDRLVGKYALGWIFMNRTAVAAAAPEGCVSAAAASDSATAAAAAAASADPHDAGDAASILQQLGFFIRKGWRIPVVQLKFVIKCPCTWTPPSVEEAQGDAPCGDGVNLAVQEQPSLALREEHLDY
jgi:hypothetical protein